MLPILRVIPVGGVLLAITILILALNPPGEPRTRLIDAAARGVLIAREQHPEWPQLLFRAALRRAEEISRLRDLPDTPVQLPPPAIPLPVQRPPEIAAVPNARSDAEPADVTGTIVQSPGSAIPVDIGESSSAELPVIPHEEQPPVIMTPRRANEPRESQTAPEAITPRANKTARRARRARPAAKQQAATQPNLFESFFGAGAGAGSGVQPVFTAQ